MLRLRAPKQVKGARTNGKDIWFKVTYASQCSNADFFLLFLSQGVFKASILAFEVKLEAIVSVLSNPCATDTEPEALNPRYCRVSSGLETVVDDIMRQLPLLSAVCYASVECSVRAKIEEQWAFNIVFREEVANFFVVLKVARTSTSEESLVWAKNKILGAFASILMVKVDVRGLGGQLVHPSTSDGTTEEVMLSGKTDNWRLVDFPKNQIIADIPNAVERRHDADEKNDKTQGLGVFDEPAGNEKSNSQENSENGEPITLSPPEGQEEADAKDNAGYFAGNDVEAAEGEQSTDDG
ncbi:hypothetical protein HG531_000536 [Fusarium graminearum]|nr:hypothetical protein HG531_000536 [Fusarium graminearum]